MTQTRNEEYIKDLFAAAIKIMATSEEPSTTMIAHDVIMNGVQAGSWSIEITRLK